MRELELLKHIYGANASLPKSVSIPPGDDMGAVRVGDQEVLVTVDQVADGVHFDLAQTPIDKIGRKAVTRSLSDVAAMAALPIGAVVAVCMPEGFDQGQADALFDALHQVAGNYGCPLFGGDVAAWNGPLILTVTVVAAAAGIGPIYREGARVGDAICVTGQLGGSGQVVDGRAHHLEFEPRIGLARTLAERFEIRAMIDISDGLARDVGHLCHASGVGGELWAESLPASEAAKMRAASRSCSVWQCVLVDGEDHELCFVMDAAKADSVLPVEVDGVDVARVGVITAATGKPVVKLRMPDGATRGVDDLGWEHGTGGQGKNG